MPFVRGIIDEKKGDFFSAARLSRKMATIAKALSDFDVAVLAEMNGAQENDFLPWKKILHRVAGVVPTDVRCGRHSPC
jgi:hypothetical protein